MTTSHSSRLFESGDTNTLYATIPARIVTVSQFPFEADGAITVTLEEGRFNITTDTEEANTG